MNELKQIIADNLIFLRKKNNLTQLELAERINYSDNAISRWERGEVTPGIEILQLLANFYNLTVEDLLNPALIKNVEKDNSALKITKVLTLIFSISIVWCVLIVMFIYLQMFAETTAWILFVLGVPISCLVSLYFNKNWGSRVMQIVLTSVFSWSLLACVYLYFLDLNLWLIFLLGIPVQSALITGYFIKSSHTRKRNFKN